MSSAFIPGSLEQHHYNIQSLSKLGTACRRVGKDERQLQVIKLHVNVLLQSLEASYAHETYLDCPFR